MTTRASSTISIVLSTSASVCAVAHDERRCEQTARDRLLEEERAERLGRRSLGVSGAEEQARATSCHRETVLDAVASCDLDDSPPEKIASGVQRLDHGLVPDVAIVAIPAARPTCSAPCVVERRKTRSWSWSRPPRAEMPPSGERRQRKPVCDSLPPRREVGCDPMHLLRPAGVPAEPADVLVEDEERPVGADELLQAAQESLARLRRPLGLEDEARDLSGMPLEQRLDRCEVVVVERQRLLLDARRNATTYGRSHHRPVVVREERMLDANRDEIAARERPSELHRPWCWRSSRPS